MNIRLIILALLLSVNSVMAQNLEDGLYAKFQTTKGEILAELYFEEMPMTVGNFVALAEGDMKDDIDNEYKKVHFYDNNKVAQIIPNLGAIFGGTAAKTPLGYTLYQEYSDSVFHERGTLTMISQQGIVDGSAFMFLDRDFPFMNGTNVPFGKIVNGLDLIEKFNETDHIKKVSIIRKGRAARKFKAFKAYEAGKAVFVEQEQEYIANEHNRAIEEIESILANHHDERFERFAKAKLEVLKTDNILPSGIRLKKWNETDGAVPVKEMAIWVEYIIYLPNGFVVESSYDNSEAARFVLGEKKPLMFWDEVINQLKLGEKATVAVPSNLAFGSKGMRGVVPPYTTLLVDLRISEISELQDDQVIKRPE